MSDTVDAAVLGWSGEAGQRRLPLTLLPEAPAHPERPVVEVLSANLRPPAPPPTYVPRPHLEGRIAGSPTPLTLVAAPPGYGKTTVVARALADDEVRTAWLTVEPSEDDPIGFWCHVHAAIGLAIGEGVGERTVAPSPQQTRSFLVQVLNHLDQRHIRLRLVLDGVHHLRDAGLLAELAFFVEHLPAGVNVVMVADRPPELPLASWRPAGMVQEIGADELAFTAEDVELLLDRPAGRRLQGIVGAVDGWPAALRLAEIALELGKTGEAPGDLVDELPTIDRYCAAILSQYPADMVDFLLDTCVAPRLVPSLCAALTERTEADAEDVLRGLIADQVFVVRGPGRAPGHRYQRRFRVFLQRELRRRDPDRLRRAHERAAAWCEAHGWRRAALEHLLHVSTVDQAVDLLATRVCDVGFPFFADQVLVEALPACDGDAPGAQRLGHALLLVGSGRLAEGALSLDHLLESTDPADRGSMVYGRTGRALLRSLVGDVEGALADADVVARSPFDDARRWAEVSAVRAALQAEDLDRARAGCDRLERGEPIDEVTDGIALPAIAARLAAREGRLLEAANLADRALVVADRLGIERQPAIADAHLARAVVAGDRLQDEVAHHELDAATELASAMRWPSYQVLVEVARFDIDRPWCEPGELLGRVEQLWGRVAVDSPPNHWARWAVRAREAAVLLDLGELARAASVIAELPPVWASPGLLARRDLLARRPSQARTRLEAMGPTSVRAEVERALLLVEVYDELGDDRMATDQLRSALAAADAEWLLASFAGFRSGVGRLLPALARAEPSAFARRVTDVLGQREARALSFLAEPLSQREERVLALLPSRLGNQEIAGELFISLNTLKTHLKSIYRKLGVGSRLDAVEVARSHGLL